MHALLPAVLPALLLSARAPAPRMRDPVDGSPEVGDSVPPELLRSLGVEGKRVALTFYNRDGGHEDEKQLLDFCERAEAYAAAGCEVLAVRNPDKGAKRDDTSSRYAALRFVDDEGDAARLALGMPVGGVRAGRMVPAAARTRGPSRRRRASPPRAGLCRPTSVASRRRAAQTLLVEPDGVIAGEVTQQLDPYAHSKMCLRVMRELDAARAAPAPPAAPSAEAAAASAYAEMVRKAEALREGS